MSTQIPFDNTFDKLPKHMFSVQRPTPVAKPEMIARNDDLAKDLGILFGDDAAEVFAGNVLPDGASPLAQLYAGHQFGNWNPQLGDGRAVLLGEVVGHDRVRRDIQLKGAGITPYSRNGDGRSWLGPVLREYLISEAMHAMGVPTTRALAAVATGEQVYRETILPGGVFTRVAQSHIRVGTFQIYAARSNKDAAQALLDHVIERHYPTATGPQDVLDAVVAAHAHLVAKWLSLGFIHGVMNTDNCSISGETIDYGPCAFMDTFHDNTVFSSIDHQGRYAYSNQPPVTHWNLAQFATALVPVMPDADKAIEEFTEIINRFPALFANEWGAVFSTKLGLSQSKEATALAQDLLVNMQEAEADFTNTFNALDKTAETFPDWHERWREMNPDDALWRSKNPMVIPRTHKIEESITTATDGDFAPFHAMLDAVSNPFKPNAEYMKPPEPEEKVLQTFCGT